MNLSNHATVRIQQRCIPRTIVQWLLDHGAEDFDGHGGIRRYFSNRSVRDLEKHYGRLPVRTFQRHLDAYLVESTDDGTVITAGRRFRRFRRR